LAAARAHRAELWLILCEAAVALFFGFVFFIGFM
jgi:hypothetical protein